MILSPIILAGGGGTRLWPLSRENRPKQFMQLFDDKSMLQNTLLRLEGLGEKLAVDDPLIVCNELHRFLVAHQCAAIDHGVGNIILESLGRNTAPALTVSALAIAEYDEDRVMLMMPADHLIRDKAGFQDAIETACASAEQGYLLTFGVMPAGPDTGYGYIHHAVDPVKEFADTGIRPVLDFKEKPDQETARKYLEAGRYLWNSGMFMMKATVWLQYMERYNPDMSKACREAYTNGYRDQQFYRLEPSAFENCRSDSIDFCVMEKLLADGSDKVLTVPVDIGWSDLGAWSSIWEIGKKDAQGNSADVDVLLYETTNSLIKTDGRLVAVVDCDNLVVIDTADATLIADKDKTQNVKMIVEQLKLSGRSEFLEHTRVYRPWGHYETVSTGDNFQIKRIAVSPGKRLSLQLHHQRAEHWIVVKGTAIVTKEEDVFQLEENQSVFIPTGVKHRLENATDQALEIVEIQFGAYLGEDDIVRFDDDFGRLDE